MLRLSSNLKVLTISKFPTTVVGYQKSAGLKQDLLDKVQKLQIPDKPKKPLSPYLKYLSENRDAIKKQNPELKLTEITQQCAKDWANVSESVKQMYRNAFVVNQEAYNKRMEEYNNNLTDIQKQALQELMDGKKADKKKRDIRKRCKETNKPKRPTGAYMMFLAETAKSENVKMTEIMAKMAGKWAALTEEGKTKYRIAYEKDRQRYNEEMAVWESKMIETGNSDIVRVNTRRLAKPTRLKDEMKVAMRAASVSVRGPAQSVPKSENTSRGPATVKSSFEPQHTNSSSPKEPKGGAKQ